MATHTCVLTRAKKPGYRAGGMGRSGTAWGQVNAGKRGV